MDDLTLLHSTAMLRFVLHSLALAFLTGAIALPALAAQPLYFRDKARGLRERELLDYFALIKRYNPDLPYRIAATDLNDDGVNEWIFMQKNNPACESNADCPIAIGGLSGGKIILLGEMRGGKISVSSEKLYGVGKLLVYNEKSNDFAYQAYVWSPTERTFRPE